MTVSEFLGTLFASFVNLSAPVLLVMLIGIAAIVGLPVIWKSWLERRGDRIAGQEERGWGWLEPVERLEPVVREVERKSNLDEVQALDASDDGMDPFAELGRLLTEATKPAEEDK